VEALARFAALRRRRSRIAGRGRFAPRKEPGHELRLA